ncbi:MAG TPA: hypothetical protein VGK03_04555 [Geothrix sp.]|jgi:hypothetical protein
MKWSIAAIGLSAVLLCGCASAPRVAPAPAKLYYGTANIFSDPPGVHVYCGGEYWGETGPTQPVTRVFWNSSNRGNANLTLKKRGYKTTSYYLVLRLEQDTREESERAPQKVVIVMDTE